MKAIWVCVLGLTMGLTGKAALAASDDLDLTPGLLAVQACVAEVGKAARVTTDYGCAEAAYVACAIGGRLERPLTLCLDGTRAALARDVAGLLDGLPRRVPAELGMPQDEYRQMRRTLVAAPDWPGCPKGDAGAECLYRHVAEQWVEARELIRAFDAVTGREAE